MGSSESKPDDGRRSRQQQYDRPSSQRAHERQEIPQEFISEHISALLQSQKEAYDARIKDIEKKVAINNRLNAQAISQVCASNTLQTQAAQPPTTGRLYPVIFPGPSSSSMPPDLPGPSHVQNSTAYHHNPFYGHSAIDANRNFGDFSNTRLSGTVTSSVQPSAPSAQMPPTRGQGHQNRTRPGIRNDDQGSACPTCKVQYGLTRIFQCSHGHSSCENCKTRQRACGICNYPITDLRNIDLEKAIAEMTGPCPNVEEGCKLYVKLADMHIHERECPFKYMNCPMYHMVPSCNWKGKLSQLKHHFNNVHPRSCTADVDREMSVPNFLLQNSTRHNLYLVAVGAYMFLIHFKVDQVTQQLYITVQLIGTKMSGNKWTYSIHIYNKNEPRRKYTYLGICGSNSEDVNAIFNDCNCLIMPLAYASTFVNNEILNYKLYITKDIDNPRDRHHNFRGRGRGRGYGKRSS